MINLKVLRDFPHKLTVEVVTTDLLPKEVFLFRHDLDGSDIYSTVCTIQALEDYSITLEPGVPFFRRSEVTKEFDSNKELESFLNVIQVDLKKLQEDYRIFLDKYGTEEIITIGD